MTDQFVDANKMVPITPPPELVEQWVDHWIKECMPGTAPQYVATQAARWGADQELETCCEWAAEQDRDFDLELRAARRPKPPSLAEQALNELNLTADPDGAELSRTQVNLIRAALERLQKLEQN